MAQINDRLGELFDRWYNQQASETEAQELMNLLRKADNEGQLEGLMKQAYEGLQPAPFFTGVQKNKMTNAILGKSTATIFTLRRIAVAASIVIVLGLGSYFMFFSKKKESGITKTNVPAKDVEAPKGTKAMITLADERTISVDSLTSIAQGNVQLIKTADGQVVYNGSSAVIEYNVFTNPRGSNVQSLTLSDGTKVWLNSESSLRYPTAFTGNERKVDVTGEAYFEVAHNNTQPFIVRDLNRNAQVQVLGTHFNVNTYADEAAVKVTLLEGSVKVMKGNAVGLLKPGQQAQVTNEVKVVNGPDLDEVMAWKNGRFELNGQTIEQIMRQIARWYDVEVEYKGPKPTANFMGGTSRQNNLSELLKILEQTNAVKFRIEGKKIIVTN